MPDNSPFKPDARLWEGKTYQQQLNFAQAATVLDSVLATEKSGDTFVEASLLKGECLFELGAQDVKNYLAALDGLRCDPQEQGRDDRAAQRRRPSAARKCLQKLGKRDAAMEMYLDVLYGRVAGDDASLAAAARFLLAGRGRRAEAGMMRESDKDFRGAIEIYKRLEAIGGRPPAGIPRPDRQAQAR